jgi:DNA-binding transcriptional regulator YdaS (Cro superfamily)
MPNNVREQTVPKIKDAVREAGGAAAVARELNMSRISVYEWVKKDEIPDKRVIPLARLTGWKYTPHMLAPSLYPNPSDGIPSLMLGSA